jgi:hypothetical protein
MIKSNSRFTIIVIVPRRKARPLLTERNGHFDLFSIVVQLLVMSAPGMMSVFVFPFNEFILLKVDYISLLIAL